LSWAPAVTGNINAAANAVAAIHAEYFIITILLGPTVNDSDGTWFK
jgi:hypothetical protein